MPLLPRRLGAKLNPPTLFLELADSESGQIFYHRLLLNDKALLGDARAIVDEISHAAPDFTESPALKVEVVKMVTTLQASKRQPGQAPPSTQNTASAGSSVPLAAAATAAGRPITPDGHERLGDRGRPRLGATYAAGSDDLSAAAVLPLQRGVAPGVAAASAAVSPPARAVDSPSSSFDLGDASYGSPAPAARLPQATQSAQRAAAADVQRAPTFDSGAAAGSASGAGRWSRSDPPRASSTELEGRVGAAAPGASTSTPSLEREPSDARSGPVSGGYQSSLTARERDPESSDDSYSDLMDPQVYRRGTGAASTVAVEAPSRLPDSSSAAGYARSTAGLGLPSRASTSAHPAPSRGGATAASTAESTDAAAERVSADVVALVTSIGDLQHAGQAQLQAAKAKMDILFDAVRLKPGDAGYEFDKRVEFQAPQAASEWDDDE